MTVIEKSKRFTASLQGLYDLEEIKSFYFLLLSYLKGFSRTDMLLKQEKVLSSKDLEFIDRAIIKLKENQPIQYIIGETEFYGLPIKVSSNVLIPRPETEELVRWMLTDCNEDKLNVVDVCCGSGCIGLSIKAFAKSYSVDLIDVSPGALSVAHENKELNDLDVAIFKQDILTSDLLKKYDVIISNPPYVSNNEKLFMNKNVLDYEPHLALFVNDDNPLVFYERIGLLGLSALNKGGKIYFEINEAFGQETKLLLQKMGYSKVQIKKDLQGKDRMLKCFL